MTTASIAAIDQIKTLNERWAKAIRAKDVDGAVANFAPDVRAFDLVEPLQSVGSDSVRKRLRDWFASFDGEIGYQTRDLAITASDDVAFSHSLNEVDGTKTDGQRIRMWWRATLCYRKFGNNWTVTHSHSSVPFDMHTNRASLDLTPDSGAVRLPS